MTSRASLFRRTSPSLGPLFRGGLFLENVFWIHAIEVKSQPGRILDNVGGDGPPWVVFTLAVTLVQSPSIVRTSFLGFLAPVEDASPSGKQIHGSQGGSVARALLDDGTFSVRAVTRDPSKPAAQKLKEVGAEVVAADMNNKESVEAALTKAYGAFVVTDYWGHFSIDKEVAQGKLIVDLSKDLGLTHVVFSGLENVKKLTCGKLEVHHFDGKGQLEEYFRERRVPMTSVRLSYYFENILTSKPQKSKDGKTYELAIPMCDVPMDGISVADLGPAVLSIFKCPSEYIGKDIGLSAGKLTVEQYAAILSEVTGKVIKDAKVPPEVYENFDFPGAAELANMFRFYQLGPCRDVQLTFKLNPKTKTFQQWCEANKDAFKDL